MAASSTGMRTASQRSTGASVTDPSKPIRPYYAANNITYTRPADWLAMTTLTPGVDKKVVALAAVYNNGSNLYALQVTTSNAGTYTVDWGDGLGPVNYASGTTASYNIAWANIGAGTVTTRGYRQAMVTISATTAGASISQMLFNVKHTNDTAANGNPHHWLEVSVCDSGLNRLTFGPEATSIVGLVFNPLLEQVNLIQTAAFVYAAATANNLDYMFAHCHSLQSVTGTILGRQDGGTNSMSGMFYNCTSLRNAPTVNAPYTTYAVNMFFGCFNLQQVDISNISTLSTTADWGQAFQNCQSLQNAPAFAKNGSNSTSWSSTFNGCSSLKNVPWIDASNASAQFFNNMFQNCTALRNAPWIRFPSSGSWSGTAMFSGCSSLVSVPAYDFSRCNAMNSMFNACANLVGMGDINAPNCITFNSAFSTCSSLRSVGFITPPPSPTNCTMTSMFQACTSLRKFGGIATNNGISGATNMFTQCVNLTSVPDLVLPSCANMNSMFSTCTGLVVAPNITVSANVTNLGTMFQNCYNLTTVPNYTFNFAASATVVGMFQNCYSLAVAPTLGNTGTVTLWSTMFSGCYSLISGGSWTTTAATDLSSMFGSCQRMTVAPTFSSTATVLSIANMFSFTALNEIPAYNFNTVSSSGNLSNWANSRGISRVQATNTRFTLTYAQCRLSASALDEIYTNLPTITAQTITVTGNWGTAADTPTIATAKGWTVTGS